MADKDVDTMIGYIAPLASQFIAIRPNYPRAMDAKTLAEKLSHYGAPVADYATVQEGVSNAIKMARPDGVVCALGSLYFSGDIRGAYANAKG